MKLKRHLRLRPSLAFSIPETVIAMAILAIAVGAVFGGFVFSYKNVQVARESLRATQILREKSETIRLYTWDQISSNGFIPLQFTNTYDPLGSNGSVGISYVGVVSLSNPPISANYSNDIKQMTIRLSWTSLDGRARWSELSTLMARHGLQSYVY